MKRQSGFTLIELIIVIVILGILAVVAAPQFFNFGSDARASTVRGLEGSIKAASELVHARAQINLQTGGQAGTGTGTSSHYVKVREGGENVEVEGLYAVASKDGIHNALSLSDVDWEVVNVSGLVPPNGKAIAWAPVSVSANATDWVHDAVDENNRGCYAYYIWSAVATGTVGQPTIGSVTEGC